MKIPKLFFNLLLIAWIGFSVNLYSAVGARLSLGVTSINNGNYYPWTSASSAASSTNFTGSGALIANTGLFELGLFLDYSPLKGTLPNKTDLSGSATTMGIEVAFFPSYELSLGVAVGHTDVYFNDKGLGGMTFQPEIAYYIPVASQGTVRDDEGEPYAKQFMMFEIRLGYRMGNLSAGGNSFNTQENLPQVQLDWGGVSVKVGFTIVLNPG